MVTVGHRVYIALWARRSALTARLRAPATPSSRFTIGRIESWSRPASEAARVSQRTRLGRESRTQQCLLLRSEMSDSHSSPSDPSATFLHDAKQLIGDDRLRLRLFDLLVGRVRQLSEVTAGYAFSTTSPWDLDVFRQRVTGLNNALTDLVVVQALLAHWTTDECSRCLTLAPTRLADRAIERNGNTGWLALQWYPALVLLYAGGIGAVAGDNYRNLARLLLSRAPVSSSRGEAQTLIKAVVSGSTDVSDAFKALPGHERDYVPRSECMFQLLREPLETSLFLGVDYERLFDHFEVLLALEHAHQDAREPGIVGWAPPGRFAYKLRGHAAGNPFTDVATEAALHRESWPPLSAGLFGGSYDRFVEVHQQYGTAVARSGWY